MAPATQAPQQLTIRQRLESEDFQAQIAKVLPRHVKPERMVRVAITALTRTPKLKDCDQSSFFLAMLNLSQWGLEPDGRRAHLIPFENRKRGICEVQLIIDYKGLVELVMRSGEVANIHADVVCENDDFEYDCGEIKRHKIDFRKPRGKVYAVYAKVRMKDGTEKCEVMNLEEVESIRKRSRAGTSGPWVTDWNEMAKKTAFRRLSKWLPLTAEVQDAMESDADQITTIATPQIGPSSFDDLVTGMIEVETEPTTQVATESIDFETELTKALAACDELGKVTEVENRFAALANSDEQRAMLGGMCDQQRDAIRASRGGKAK